MRRASRVYRLTAAEGGPCGNRGEQVAGQLLASTSSPFWAKRMTSWLAHKTWRRSSRSWLALSRTLPSFIGACTCLCSLDVSLTDPHPRRRVLVYQFDDQWNGQAVAELVDWNKTHDLYMGLNFPASDIPKQARDLYTISMLLCVLFGQYLTMCVSTPFRPCSSTVRPVTADCPTRVQV